MTNKISFIFFFTIFLVARPCWSGVHETFGIGAKATSLGGAFTAYADDFSAIHYNPAGIIQNKGTSISTGLHVIDLDYKQKVKQTDTSLGSDPLSGTSSENNSDLLYVPQIGVVYSPKGGKWAFAYGIYAPFGLHGWWNSHNANNRFDVSETYNNRIVYASPTIAYRFFENISIGISIGFGYAEEGFSTRLRVPGLEQSLGPPYDKMSGLGYQTTVGNLSCNLDDDLTVSTNIGILWEATDRLSFGLTYRSKSHAKMKGDSTYKYTRDAIDLLSELGVDAPESETFETKLSFTYPQSIGFGGKIDLTDKWRVMADVTWTDWSARSSENLSYDGEPVFLQLADSLDSGEPTDGLSFKRNWVDTYEFRIGTEYQSKEWLAVRFGYHYRPSGIKEKYWDNTWPLIDFHIFSLGSGMRLSKHTTIDLCYSLALGEDWDIENGESQNLTTQKVIYSPYAGDDVQVETKIHSFIINYTYRF